MIFNSIESFKHLILNAIDDLVINGELSYVNGGAIHLQDIDRLYFNLNDAAGNEYKPINRIEKNLEDQLVRQLANQASDKIFSNVNLLASELQQFLRGPNRSNLSQVKEYLHRCLVYLKVLNNIAEREGISTIFEAMDSLKLPTMLLLQMAITNGQGR